MLESVDFSSKLTYIGTSGLAYCISLTTVGDLSGIKSMGSNVFNGCKLLKYLKFTQTVPPSIGDMVFYGSTYNIYVPDNSVSVYQSATNWSTYASRIKALSTFVEP